MSRLLKYFIALSLAIFQYTSAQEIAKIESLISEDSPLRQNEVIAFFGDSITQSGASPGGYCRRIGDAITCLLYTSPSPRDRTRSRMPSSA